jgi:hypothetical protein
MTGTEYETVTAAEMLDRPADYVGRLLWSTGAEALVLIDHVRPGQDRVIVGHSRGMAIYTPTTTLRVRRADS